MKNETSRFNTDQLNIRLPASSPAQSTEGIYTMDYTGSLFLLQYLKILNFLKLILFS